MTPAKGEAEPQAAPAPLLGLSARGWLTGAAVLLGAYAVAAIFAGALSAFVLLFAAIVFAAGLRPIIDRLSTRMPAGVAVGITFACFILIVGLLVYFLAAPVVNQIEHFHQATPAQVRALHDHFGKIAALAPQSGGAALNSVATQLLRGSALIAQIASDAILVVLLALGWITVSNQLSTFVLSLLPSTARASWQSAFDTIDDRLSAYVQGVVLNGTIVGVVIAGALALLGIPYSLLLGFVAATLQAIPMLGAVFSGIILLLAVLATSGWAKMLAVLAVFAIVQVIDQNAVSPLIFGKRVQMSFLSVVFSTVLGGTLFGIVGAFLAVPAAAVLSVILSEIVAPAIRRASQ